MGYIEIMTDEFDPLTGEILAKGTAPASQPATPPVEPLSIPDEATLAGMDKDALVTLVMRMAGQCGLVATMTEEETAQAMLDTLAHTALKPITSGISMKADIQSRLAAIDKWLDRTRGKPAQTQVIDMNVKGAIATVNVTATDRFFESLGIKPPAIESDGH